MGLAFLVIGLSLAATVVAYRWHLSDKADRLLAEGRLVAAQVTDFYSGSGRGSGADWVEVTYSLDGSAYRGRVKCGGGTGCVNAPGPEVTVLVAPDDPHEFLLRGGNVTGSLSFFNSWTMIPFGLVLAATGGALLTITVIARRQAVSIARRAGDRPAGGVGTPPKRPARTAKRKGQPS
jgi:hypothetical protein